jgi:hypothetical protein
MVQSLIVTGRSGTSRMNPDFYGHGLIAVGHITYRVHVLRQTRYEHHNIDTSLHRTLKASLKLYIVHIIMIVSFVNPKCLPIFFMFENATTTTNNNASIMTMGPVDNQSEDTHSYPPDSDVLGPLKPFCCIGTPGREQQFY